MSNVQLTALYAHARSALQFQRRWWRLLSSRFRRARRRFREFQSSANDPDVWENAREQLAQIIANAPAIYRADLSDVDLKGKGVMAFPNPAREVMYFVLHLDNASDVDIIIYNFAGEPVVKISESLPAGQGQLISWSCQDAVPGIYILQLCINGKHVSRQKIAINPR